MREIINKILDICRDNQSCVTAVIVASSGSSPRKVGARMLVDAGGRTAGTVGGGTLEKLVERDALAALKRKQSFLKEYSLDKKAGLAVCGGKVGVFFDVISSPRRLVIAGGGHIGLSLSLIAKLLGYEVIVVDNRREFAGKTRFSHVDRVLCGPYDKVLSKWTMDARTAIVIVTHGHLHDASCLAAALASEAGYIGMIGSRRKIRHIFEQMRRKGFSSKRLKDVYAPVGLDIGAETPQEIAVAIAAELIKISRL